MFSVTLIATPAEKALSQSTVDALARELDAQELRWLEAGVACRLIVDSGQWTVGSLRSHLSSVIRHPSSDVFIQPHPLPRYRLFVADMESTIIENECLDELADYVGLREKIEAITARAMNGELDFAQALAERVGLLSGLPTSALQEVYDQRVRLMPGAEALMAALKAAGIRTMLVSGGFSFYTQRIQARLGFDEERSNQLEIKNPHPAPLPQAGEGILSGRVLPPILDKNAKRAALLEGCDRLGISPAEAIAIGDGANDVPMLLAAGLGVAYRAKPNVRKQVQNQINHGDLRTLIWALRE